MVATHLYGFVPAIPQTVYPYVGIVAVAIGLMLAFFGEAIWRIATTIIGSIIGAVIGLAFGVAIAGFIGALLVGLIGAIIGGLLFYYIAEAGISLMVAYFSLLGVLILFGVNGGLLGQGTRASALPFIVALVVAVIVFIVCIIYFKDLIAIFTAVGGGFLIDYGLTVLHSGSVATIVSLAVILLGMVFQFVRIARKKKRLTAVPDYGTNQAGGTSYTQEE